MTTGRASDRTPARTRMFATAVPGIGRLLADELRGLDGVDVTHVGFDGRADLVLFETQHSGAQHSAARATLRLRLAEDVFVEAGRTLRAEGDRAGWIAGRIWKPERARRALDTRAALVGPASTRASFRVIVRVLQERSFLRTDLRREFARAVARDRPGWRLADPAQLEVWVSEYQPGKLVAGLRLTDVRMRQHDGRVEERAGALRPTVAAAMVGLAGQPDGLLLDPCCGSGTILAEATAAGWRTIGRDTDPAAVRIARRNAPDAEIVEGDARAIALATGAVSACVSNLPFGNQYDVPEPMAEWLRAVLAEMARVTRPGGRVVVLAPTVSRAAAPSGIRLVGRHPLRLLGTKTALWVYQTLR